MVPLSLILHFEVVIILLHSSVRCHVNRYLAASANRKSWLLACICTCMNSLQYLERAHGLRSLFRWHKRLYLLCCIHLSHNWFYFLSVNKLCTYWYTLWSWIIPSISSSVVSSYSYHCKNSKNWEMLYNRPQKTEQFGFSCSNTAKRCT